MSNRPKCHPTPKRHHFVPAFYLKRFVESPSGALYVLDLGKQEIRKQKPDQVMFIKKYYCQTGAPPEVDKNILEFRLGDLERKAKASIEKLVENPSTLNDDDTANIVTYLHYQRIRVPRQIKLYDQILKAQIEAIADSIPEVAQELAMGRYKLTIKEASKFYHMKNISDSHVYTDIFSSMVWGISEAPKNKPFITTDSPVSFFNPMIEPPDEAGPGLLGTLVFFPLSPHHLLELRHRQMDDSNEDRYLDRIPIHQCQDGQIEIRIGYLLSELKVNQINWALASLAERYIVSNHIETLQRILADIIDTYKSLGSN